MSARWIVLALGVAAACQSGEVRDSLAPTRESAYEAVVAPILRERCIGCHGAERAKGGLRLHTPEAIRAGGSMGAVVVPGNVGASELVRRLHLALDDDEHMPPDDKPQLDAAQIATLERWIAAGAPYEGPVDGLVAPQKAPAPTKMAAADPAALSALRNELVHVQAVSQGSHALWIDFAAIAPRTDDALVERLLTPLKSQTSELALARSKVGGATLAFCGRLPALRKLDLRDTKVGDAELAGLGAQPALEELVLARTSITDASVDTLLALPALRSVHLWGCQFSPDALARLRAKPTLRVDFGDTPDTVIAEVEEKPKFTSELPSPDLPPAGDPSAPINANCPVTGSPINPKYTRTFEGKVIAFCCPNCPGEFDTDPATYAAKLP